MLKLYHRASDTLIPFRPLRDPVTVYVCGITPYDTTHLGHAFTYVSFDVLMRYLEYQGYTVRYVQNVTDIDDDILRKGREVGEDWLALGNRWTRHFIEDLQRLNVRPPEVYPRATDVIAEMLQAIQTLISKGHAYVSDGNVYYDVASFDDFGQVSGLAPDAWLPTANERGNVPDDPNKRAPLDFVLWQAQKEGEPGWPSPWGMGRPGWHIECSTMAKTYLGETIDIHGGGSDLSFPHHDCETAQACGVSGRDFFAQFWLHAAMVHYQGAKMSKSLGNLIWARELMDQYGPDTVRVLISSHPYNKIWSFDAAELVGASATANTLTEAMQVSSGNGAALDASAAVSAFEQAMDDNLATDRALQAVLGLAKAILATAARGGDVASAQADLAKLGTVLGLCLGKDIEPRVRQGWEQHHRRFV